MLIGNISGAKLPTCVYIWDLLLRGQEDQKIILVHRTLQLYVAISLTFDVSPSQ